MLRGLPRWLGIVLVAVLTTVWAVILLVANMKSGDSFASLGRLVVAADWMGLVAAAQSIDQGAAAHQFYWHFGLPVMLVASLVVGIRCSGAVTGEREKQTWEALLLTPLETRQLIRGKFWGICGATWPYLLAYAVPALLLSAVGGLGAFLWTLLWLGVTVLAMAFVGGAGLWCSVRSSSSWRSLLATLGFAYGGGLLLFCIASPVVLIVSLLITFMLALFDMLMGTSAAMAFGRFQEAFNVSMCVTLAGIFVFLAWRLVVSAEYRVGVLERTKHWKHEPRQLHGRRPYPIARPASRSRRYEDEDDDY